MRFKLENTVAVMGKICSGGIKMLENFTSPISATVYEKCIEAGMEFRGFCDPYEYGDCDFVLCRDVFGKIAAFAAKNGLVYAEAAYGTVSRYGIMQAVSSGDRVGVLSKSVDVAAEVLTVISGYDKKDGTMLETEKYAYGKDYFSPKLLFANDAEMKYFSLLPAVYYCIASAEIANNASRFDGVKYGQRASDAKTLDELYVRSRSEGLPRDIRLASVIGNMVLSKENYERWYYKAMQIRRLVLEHYTKILTEHDVLILPIEEASIALTALCGFASVATKYENEPCLLVCSRGKENAMFCVGDGR